MILANPSDLLGRVIDTLRDHVLPHMAVGSWPTSNVKSCLALLVYYQDCVSQQSDVIAANNASLKEFLTQACSEQYALGELCKDIGNVIARQDTTDSFDMYRQYRELTARVIAFLHSHRDASSSERSMRRQELQTTLRDCLRLVHEREYSLAVRAQEMALL